MSPKNPFWLLRNHRNRNCKILEIQILPSSFLLEQNDLGDRTYVNGVLQFLKWLYENLELQWYTGGGTRGWSSLKQCCSLTRLLSYSSLLKILLGKKRVHLVHEFRLLAKQLYLEAPLLHSPAGSVRGLDTSIYLTPGEAIRPGTYANLVIFKYW